MTVLIATTVLRGSHQADGPGSACLVDLEGRRVRQAIDWTSQDVDAKGGARQRGLRGIAFDGDRVFMAASDELFLYNAKFEQLASYRCPYLKNCQAIGRYKRRLLPPTQALAVVIPKLVFVGVGVGVGEGRFARPAGTDGYADRPVLAAEWILQLPGMMLSGCMSSRCCNMAADG